MAERPPRLQRLYLEIALSSAAAWAGGVLALAGVALWTGDALREQELDATLWTHAIAAYGLAYYDEDDVFQTEYLVREAGNLDPGVQIWIAEPERLMFASEGAGEPPVDLFALAGQVVDADVDRLLDDDVGGRVLAIPTYDEQDRVRAAIVVRADSAPGRDGWLVFAARIAAASAAMIALGIAVSASLARRSLAPLAASMRERERFLAGAAHELRTPVATIRALAESGAPDALDQIAASSARAGGMVDRLLTWGRLNETALAAEPLRLDLLVEAALTDDEAHLAAAFPEVVVQGDPRLLGIAARNLLENARVHGGGIDAVVVRDDPPAVTVADRGPGLPEGIALTDPFVRGADSPGSGLGLALVDRIAGLHGGRLVFDARVGGGAEIRLELGSG